MQKADFRSICPYDFAGRPLIEVLSNFLRSSLTFFPWRTGPFRNGLVRVFLDLSFLLIEQVQQLS